MQTIEQTVPKGGEINPEIKALFDAGGHVGYSRTRRHPGMQEYIYCTRNDTEIFNLEKTEESLKIAMSFLEDLGRQGKSILWVGTKPVAQNVVEIAGTTTNTPYVTRRWLGGTLTNFKMIEERMNYFQQLEKESNTGELGRYVKKERLLKIAELAKLQRMFGGIRTLSGVPHAMVIVDPDEEYVARDEALSVNMPIVALMSSDCNPANIKFPIPANDNAIQVVSLVVKRLQEAYLKGKKEIKITEPE
jgi:small subunit ribosomal protein S2